MIGIHRNDRDRLAAMLLEAHVPKEYESKRKPVAEQPAEPTTNIGKVISDLKLYSLEQKQDGFVVTEDELLKKIMEDYSEDIWPRSKEITDAVLSWI